MNVNEYWESFLEESGLSKDTGFYDAFSFWGNSNEESDMLADLVLSGKKKATTSIYLPDETYPHIGSYSIVLDHNEEPLCIVRTVNTRIMKFKEMTFEIASLEGEDEILDTWKNNHRKMFELEGEELGYSFSEESLIFFEEFEVVYK